ncbi:MAG TPA: cysteine synthase family protein, partial [Candidatus Caccomonas pullistercoris]|nr:cysteine synthase family protein [Candidatus Caccomonas pullistercoris]
MKIANQLTELIGTTPLLSLERYSRDAGLDMPLVAKLEMKNPGGSAKDRAALSMIASALSEGKLQPGGTIIEPTSGNMGVALAWIASAMGLKTIIVMPDTMSRERRDLIRAYGAELRLSPGGEGMAGAVALAERICRETPGAVILGQFDNPDNPAAHARTTAREIWNDTDGTVDVLVAGVGTGGTISGTGRTLKQLNA